MRAETIRLAEELRSMKDDYVAGASASLNKTTRAIMKFLDDEDNCPPERLRDFLYGKLGDFAVKWYRHGFNRGHRESNKQSRRGRIPRILRYDGTREFFTDDERTVHLKSTLKKKRSEG